MMTLADVCRRLEYLERERLNPHRDAIALHGRQILQLQTETFDAPTAEDHALHTKQITELNANQKDLRAWVSAAVRDLSRRLPCLPLERDFAEQTRNAITHDLHHPGCACHPSESLLSPNHPYDIVTSPEHYVAGRAIEPRFVIADWKLDWNEGCVLSYLARWKKKNGVEDLKKAREHLNFLIEQEERLGKQDGGTK